MTTTVTTPLPHYEEAEASVLGAALLDDDAADVVLGSLEAADFYNPQHQAVLAAMHTVWDQNRALDAITVNDELRRVNARGADVRFVIDLMDGVPTASNVSYYIEIVKEQSRRRQLMRAGNTIIHDVSQSQLPVAELIDKAEAEVFAVAEKDLGPSLRLTEDLVGGYLEELEARAQGSDDAIRSGFVDLDELVPRLRPGNVVVLAARPSVGKTTLALAIGRNVASTGRPVAVFSMEMSYDEVLSVLVAMSAKLSDSQVLETGDISEQDWHALAIAANDIGQLPIAIDDTSSRTLSDIRSACRRLKRQTGDLGLIIVDYLQLMRPGARGDNREQEVAEISRGLKRLADELGAPVLAVSQLNRAVEQRQDKRPQLADLRESGSLEQDADIVLLMYRDDYYNPETDEANVAEINVAKNRRGRTGRAKLNYVRSRSRFENYRRQPEPHSPPPQLDT
ncbi:MAG: replicative DNA helicase [Acidimicrobiia bacterium]|nr:replicative DNA helicase [Acidimicrobiia bacterium]